MLDHSHLPPRLDGIVLHDFEWMQVDIAVRAILGAEAAADAPVLDDHLERIAPADRTHRAAHHTQRVSALAAGRGHQVLVKSEPLAHQPRNAVVGIGASAHASIAARALFQVQDQQALRFHQSLRQEVVKRHRAHDGEPIAVLLQALLRCRFQAPADLREPLDHLLEVFAVDANHFDVIERGACGGAHPAAQ